jgi:hypothetical protein
VYPDICVGLVLLSEQEHDNKATTNTSTRIKFLLR